MKIYSRVVGDIRTAILCAASMVLLASCNSLGAYSNTQTFHQEAKLSGARIFIYPLTDLIRDDIGYKLLRDFDHRLVAAFSAAGIESQFALPSFRAVEALPQPTGPRVRSYLPTSQSLTGPIVHLVSKFEDDEASFGATHRLLILPTEVSTVATVEGSDYTIRWVLVDVRSEEIILTTDYEESNQGDKNAMREERAQNWADGLVEQLRLAGLL